MSDHRFEYVGRGMVYNGGATIIWVQQLPEIVAPDQVKDLFKQATISPDIIYRLPDGTCHRVAAGQVWQSITTKEESDLR